MSLLYTSHHNLPTNTGPLLAGGDAQRPGAPQPPAHGPHRQHHREGRRRVGEYKEGRLVVRWIGFHFEIAWRAGVTVHIFYNCNKFQYIFLSCCSIINFIPYCLLLLVYLLQWWMLRGFQKGLVKFVLITGRKPGGGGDSGSGGYN